MARLLVLDTESGGVDPDVHSILSIAGVVWEDGRIIAEKEVLIHEDPFVVTARALEINGIDLVEHAKHAIPPKDATTAFEAFLESKFVRTGGPDDKVVIAAHNAGFDIGMTQRLYRMGSRSFTHRFSHRSLDTAGMLRTLFLAGKVPESATTSSGAFAHFGIRFPEGKRHTALGDARATAEMLDRILELLRS